MLGYGWKNSVYFIVPQRLHSGNGKEFGADVISKLCKNYNIEKSKTISDSIGCERVEKLNRVVHETETTSDRTMEEDGLNICQNWWLSTIPQPIHPLVIICSN